MRAPDAGARETSPILRTASSAYQRKNSAAYATSPRESESALPFSMVISLASRSASRMISSKDLRRTSARSRGFLPAQASKAALAASIAALASSTVALATEAILFSVAGSRTSKRPPSEDLRHLPPIHRSVGTLARRLSYLGLMAGPHIVTSSCAGLTRASIFLRRCDGLPGHKRVHARLPTRYARQ